MPDNRVPSTAHGVTMAARKKAVARFLRHADEAIDEILDIMRDPMVEPATRLRAAQDLLDRGLGKPKQAVDLRTDETRRTTVIDMDRLKGLGDDELALFLSVLERLSKTEDQPIEGQIVDVTPEEGEDG